MKIWIVRPYGFCSGVKRALRLLDKAKKNFLRVYTLGEIIHNRPMVEKLKSEGIIPIARIRKNLSGILAIRTHGISARHLKKIKNYGIKILDTTCPYVRRVQEIAEMLSKDGYKVVVVGDKNHPEVVSIMENIRGSGLLFSTDQEFGIGAARPRAINPDESFFNRLGNKDKVGVVCQTTVSQETLLHCLALLAKKDLSELRVFNTICQEVSIRQKRFKEALANACACVVVGGKKSANTQRLYQIGCASGKPCFWIEEEKEWPEVKSFLNELEPKTVCFVSGTSTPDELFLRLVKNIKKEEK